MDYYDKYITYNVREAQYYSTAIKQEGLLFRISDTQQTRRNRWTRVQRNKILREILGLEKKKSDTQRKRKIKIFTGRQKKFQTRYIREHGSFMNTSQGWTMIIKADKFKRFQEENKQEEENWQKTLRGEEEEEEELHREN